MEVKDRILQEAYNAMFSVNNYVELTKHNIIEEFIHVETVNSNPDWALVAYLDRYCAEKLGELVSHCEIVLSLWEGDNDGGAGTH